MRDAAPPHMPLAILYATSPPPFHTHTHIPRPPPHPHPPGPRYIPVGLLEVIPQHMQHRPPAFFGRSDLETLLASDQAQDWVRGEAGGCAGQALRLGALGWEGAGFCFARCLGVLGTGGRGRRHAPEQPGHGQRWRLRGGLCAYGIPHRYGLWGREGRVAVRCQYSAARHSARSVMRRDTSWAPYGLGVAHDRSERPFWAPSSHRTALHRAAWPASRLPLCRTRCASARCCWALLHCPARPAGGRVHCRAAQGERGAVGGCQQGAARAVDGAPRGVGTAGQRWEGRATHDRCACASTGVCASTRMTCALRCIGDSQRSTIQQQTPAGR